MVGILPGCCARVDSGQIAAPPPTSVMKSRRLITHPRSGLIERTGRSLFDHFIGAILYRLRHGDAECLCSLEVEEQLDFACLLDRQVGGFLALEDTADVPASEAIGIYDAAAIANQAAGCHELVILINHRQRIADRQCSQLFEAVIKECIRAYDERTGTRISRKVVKALSSSASVLA